MLVWNAWLWKWLQVSTYAPKALHSHPNPAQASPAKTHAAHRERALLFPPTVHSVCPLPPKTRAVVCRRKHATHVGELLHLVRALGRAEGGSLPEVQHPFITKEDEWVHPLGNPTAKNWWSSVWTSFLDCETNWKIFIQNFFFFLTFLNLTSLFMLPKNQLIVFREVTISWRRELLFPRLTKISSKLYQ